MNTEEDEDSVRSESAFSFNEGDSLSVDSGSDRHQTPLTS